MIIWKDYTMRKNAIKDPNGFSGEFQTKLLCDGRIRLPAEVRRNLNRHGNHKFKISILPNDCALIFLPEYYWRTWLGKIKIYFPVLDSPQELRTFNALSKTVQCDKQNRIFIPPRMQRHAGIAPYREVVIIGSDDHYELWDSDTYEHMVQNFHNVLQNLGFSMKE